MRAVLATLMSMLLAADFASAATDLPPVGRSLFDQLTIVETGGKSEQRIPYPFAALLRALESRAGTDSLGRPGVAAVLIPLGRSLQRNASLQNPFEHPRVVAAITGEMRQAVPRHAPHLKDRLFLGFQDDAGVIEVISYNEAAGRFEFQVVKDYRAGREPQVFYANRTVCTACHHNAAPIFSRPSWDETNANPSVARALSARAQAFHGVRVARGVDVPNAIDDAVARANRISLVQLLWRDGCARTTHGSGPAGCRGAALAAALKLRLSASGEVDLDSPRARTELLQPLAGAWKAQWPTGLVEPDPSIANRDPFFGGAQRIDQPQQLPWAADEIGPAIDPLALRPPAALWHGDVRGTEHFIRSLAEMLAAADIDALATWLQRLPDRSIVRDRVGLQCKSAAGAPQRQLRCTAKDGAGAALLEGTLRFEGVHAVGTVARLRIGPHSLREIALRPAAIERRGAQRRARLQVAASGAAARLADGRALEALELEWGDAPDTASYRGELVLKDEFSVLQRGLTAIAEDTRANRSDVFAALPFRRASTLRTLFAHLGIEGAPTCCEAPPTLPAPRIEREERFEERPGPTALRLFYRHCGACHAAPDPSPPGFLHGDPASVAASLARCAPRIDYRLAMWRLAPGSRSKVTMPPPSFAASWEHAPPSDDVALMRSYVAGLHRSVVPAVPDGAYESLPACRFNEEFRAGTVPQEGVTR